MLSVPDTLPHTKITSTLPTNEDEVAPQPPVVIDLGSYNCKAGFGGDDAPRAVFRNVVGRERIPISGSSHHYVGDEAQAKRAILSLAHPIWEGEIVNEDMLEKLYDHIFMKELRVIAAEQPAVVTHHSLRLQQDYEKHAQLLFEKQEVPSLYLASSEKLALYASGRTSGVVLDLGHTLSSAVSIFEDHPLWHTLQKSTIAGQEVTENVIFVTSQSGFTWTGSSERTLAEDIKRSVSHIAPRAFDYRDGAKWLDRMNNDVRACWRHYGNDNATYLALLPQDVQRMVQSFQLVQSRPYELPDGQVIFLQHECFAIPEILFAGRPNSNVAGIAEMLRKTITSTECQMHRDVVISGGSALFPGMRERIHNELSQHFVNPRVIEAGSYASWIGGSLITVLAPFAEMQVSRAEYQESGARVLGRKFW